jgi:hypothetical protein
VYTRCFAQSDAGRDPARAGVRPVGCEATPHRRARDTDDVVFADPEGQVAGRDALESKAAAPIDGAPAEFAFEEDGIAYLGRDSGALAWTFGPAGSPVARGIDLITVRDGRISTLRTLLSE